MARGDEKERNEDVWRIIGELEAVTERLRKALEKASRSGWLDNDKEVDDATHSTPIERDSGGADEGSFGS